MDLTKHEQGLKSSKNDPGKDAGDNNGLQEKLSVGFLEIHSSARFSRGTHLTKFSMWYTAKHVFHVIHS